MIEDFRIKVFVTLARCGSFTAAARELNVSQPAVSQNISELEKKLGVLLFNRARGSVTLTDNGTLFLGYANQIMHWYAAAEEAFGVSADLMAPMPSSLETKPVTVDISDTTAVEISSSLGDLHLRIINK